MKANYTTRHPSSADSGTQKRKPDERSAPVGKRDRALELIKRGLEFLATGDRKGGWNQFTLALQADPDCREAYYEMARLQHGLGNLTAADRLYQQALEGPLARTGKRPRTQSPLLDAHIGRGMIAWEKRAWKDAVGHFDRAASQGLNPSDAVRQVAGECLLRLGRVSDAVEGFEQAPWNAEGLMNFGLALFLLGDLNRAAATLRRYFLLNPNPADVLVGFPRSQNAPGRPSEHLPEAPEGGFWGETPPRSEDANGIGRGYWERCCDLWKKSPGALEFLSALWMDPQVVDELEESRRIEMALQVAGDTPQQARLAKKLNRLRSPVRIHNSQTFLLQRLPQQLG